MTEEKEFVRMMSCAFCGKDTGIAIDQKMGRTKAFNDPKCLTPKGTVPDMNGCDECQKRFKDHKYFVGDCGHEGFIKTEAFEKIFPPDFVKQVGKGRIFRMDKCFVCSGFVKEKDVKKIQ